MAQTDSSQVVVSNNKEVFAAGKVVQVEKMGSVLMVDFGPLCDLPRHGIGCVTFIEDGSVFVRTQEKPDGAEYLQSWHLIVRPTITPAAGTVHVDAYAMSPENVFMNRGRAVAGSLRDQIDPVAYGRIRPLLDDMDRAEMSCDIFWSYTDRRQAVLVTSDLLSDDHLLDLGVSDGSRLAIRNEWGEDCYAVEGDAIIVTDYDAGAGYRVEAEAFRSTYRVIDE